MTRVIRSAIVGAVWASALWIGASQAVADPPQRHEERRYVVIVDDSGATPQELAKRHGEHLGANVERVLTGPVDGYSANLEPAEAKAIAKQPGVAAVGLDPVGEPAAQELPFGARRLFAMDGDCNPSDNPMVNQALDVDCVDDYRVDADIAILDTSIDPAHPDLNVVSNVDCFGNDPTPEDDDPSDNTGCEAGPGNLTEECHGWHGEVVAEPMAAIDNEIGTVGMAPGARIWSVGVADTEILLPSSCSPPAPFYMSDVIAGVEWVTEHADEIEVANMSMGFQTPTSGAGLVLATAMEEAIEDSIDAGVIYVVAAGNDAAPLTTRIPASFERVMTATATLDSDGLPGGIGPNVGPLPCPAANGLDRDDTNSIVSNYGPAAGIADPWAAGADIAAPGVCTSIASAHTSGAAAIVASDPARNPSDASGVAAVRRTLLTSGNIDSKANGGWDDELGTGPKEPLLQVGCESLFTPAMVAGTTSGSRVQGGSPKAESDVNCDGRSDLVTLRPDGTVLVHPGSSTGAFGSAVTAGSLNPAQYDGVGHYVIDVADVDSNGRADLVTVTDGGDVHVLPGGHVLPGTSDSTFGPATVTDLNLNPALLEAGGNEPIAVADVNKDGYGDLVSYNDVTDKVMVYPGAADRTFGTGIEARSGVDSALHDNTGEYFIDVADVTGDGHADLVSMTSSDDLRVYRGTASGTFNAPVDSHAGQIDAAMDDANGYEPVGVGDVGNDGYADLLLRDNSGYLKLFPGSSTGAFGTMASPWPNASLTTTFASASGHSQLFGLLDVTGEGNADVVGTMPSVSNAFIVKGQNGNGFSGTQASFAGSFQTTQNNQTASTRHEIASEKPSWKRRGCQPQGCSRPGERADVNGDDRADLVTLRPDSTVLVHNGATTGGFASGVTAGSLNPAQYDGVGHYVIDVTDVDSNGRSDLVTMTDGGDVHVLPGRYDSTFGAATVSDLNLTPALLAAGGDEPIAVADVNKDGYGDLVSYNDVTDKVMVYPGAVDRSFGTGIQARSGVVSAIHTGTGEYFVDVADVNNDGYADLVSMTSSDNLRVYPGQAAGTFNTPVDSHVGQIDAAMDDANGYEPIGVGDVGNDGYADLALRDDSGYIRLFPGTSTGAFAAMTTPWANASPTSTFGSPTGHSHLAGLLDVTGDGYDDLLGAVLVTGNAFTVKGQANNTFITGLASFGGTFQTTQHNQTASTRHEMASEKPSWKRRGCPAAGCN